MSKILRIIPKMIMGLLTLGQKTEAYRVRSKVYFEVSQNSQDISKKSKKISWKKKFNPIIIFSPREEIQIDLRKRLIVPKEDMFFIYNFDFFTLKLHNPNEIFAINETLKKFFINLQRGHYMNYFMGQSMENFTIQDAFSIENPRSFKFLSVEKIITDVYGLEKYMVIEERRPHYKNQLQDTLNFAQSVEHVCKKIFITQKTFCNEELRKFVKQMFDFYCNEDQRYFMFCGIERNLKILSFMDSGGKDVLKFKNSYKKKLKYYTEDRNINNYIVSLFRRILTLELCIPLFLNKEEIEKNITEEQKNNTKIKGTLIQENVLKKEIKNLENLFLCIKGKFLDNFQKTKKHYETTTGKIFGINVDISFDVVAKDVLKNILYWTTLENSDKILENKIKLLTTTMGLLLIKKEIINYNKPIPFVKKSYMGTISSTMVNLMAHNIYKIFLNESKFNTDYVQNVKKFWAMEKQKETIAIKKKNHQNI